eukprot:CAMPEP_0183319830 /NCGR_PEP_ID=MMETSP0160_2-20130417/64718_1 /TAXON_ID=2839 ORGANISM="Odontella Sinensis, Strain Grunow 1884" /NCGR_SAMPLE_ID=MMETSP0160_2 /ASSEMBLY_ACC=CAM_ASM_000250 /LENGTH=104 /DNA_ID=CAMNT_0025486397 /DNA_START=41 /DNA_END=355 /DNA_ORIENTATION=+
MATTNHTHQFYELEEEGGGIISILEKALAVSTQPSLSLPSQNRHPGPRSGRNSGTTIQHREEYPRDSLIALLSVSVGQMHNQHMPSADQQPHQDAPPAQASHYN